MNDIIKSFVSIKEMAFIGISSNSRKFGNLAFKELQAKNYTLYPIHSTESTFEGIKCYSSLSEIDKSIKNLYVCTSPENISDILEKAKISGIENVWIQRGGESNVLIKKAEELGINLVTNKCILMYAEPVKSIHKFHQTLTKLFGNF